MKDPVPDTDWCVALYQAHGSVVLLYGRALGLSHSEAEDVLHEVFRELLTRKEAPIEPHRYLVRSFRNRALNFRRSFMRRLGRELESRGWFETDPEPSEAEGEAMRALERLPREQREVIVLKIWHDQTFEAIGELLGLSPNTVAGRYRYGMQKLRRYLTQTGYERDGFLGNAFEVLDSPATVRGT